MIKDLTSLKTSAGANGSLNSDSWLSRLAEQVYRTIKTEKRQFKGEETIPGARGQGSKYKQEKEEKMHNI